MRKANIAWRSCIIGAGFLYSFLLFKQQFLQVQAARLDQQQVVTKAVTDSNKHTDKGLESLEGRLHSQIRAVSDQVFETQKNISKSIDGVRTPPPEIAKLKFTFPARVEKDFPKERLEVAVVDNVVKVPFSFRNTSHATAKNIEVWVHICDGCTYTKDPEGFVRLSGMDEKERYRHFNILNPTIGMQDLVAEYKIPSESSATNPVQMSFRYVCETCGIVPSKDEWQHLWVVPIRQ